MRLTFWRRKYIADVDDAIGIQLRRGGCSGLTPDGVEAYLGPAPTDRRAYNRQPKWLIAARQWAFEASLPPAVYAEHGRVPGNPGPSVPFTVFQCPKGHTAVGSPHAAPDHHCYRCDHEGSACGPDEWTPASAKTAGEAVYQLMGGDVRAVALATSASMP